jgi:predicted ATPase
MRAQAVSTYKNYQGKGEINIEKFPPLICEIIRHLAGATLGDIVDQIAEIRRRHGYENVSHTKAIITIGLYLRFRGRTPPELT